MLDRPAEGLYVGSHLRHRKPENTGETREIMFYPKSALKLQIEDPKPDVFLYPSVFCLGEKGPASGIIRWSGT